MNSDIVMDPAKQPFFTVVIPTYNRSAMLAEAIDSVLAQTFTDFELIVIDDHSQDDTAQVVASFADPRICYLLNERSKGACGARNSGIFRARGAWIAFQDDDDLWLPTKLAHIAEKIGSVGEQIGLIYAGYTTVDADGSTHRVLRRVEGHLLDEILYKNILGGFQSVVIRRNLLLEVNGLDERFPAMQDLELFIALAQLTEVAFVAKPLVQVRRGHAERISTNWRNKLIASQLLAAKYQTLYARSPRLRHRAASRIFVFAWLAGDWSAVRQSLWWTLLGFLIDIKNVLWIVREIVSKSRNVTRVAQ